MERTTVCCMYLAGVFVLVVQSVPAFADPTAYCDAFARDLANRKMQGDSVSETSGTAIDRGEAVAAGEIVGSIATPTPESAPNIRWRRVYGNLFDGCMQQYGVSDTSTATSKRPANQSNTKVQLSGQTGTLKPGTQAWNQYCQSKHPSFNAKTGTYQTISGKQRKCGSD